MAGSQGTPKNVPPGLEELRDPSPDFVEQVLAIVRAIPPGRAMAYGDVADALDGHADLAGTTGSYGARLVGNVMSRFGADVPWWRVIRSTGHPPRFHEEKALAHYRAEGTPLTGPDDNYRIDLKRARHEPGAETATQASLDLS
jgi:alkylated DNA nucleotide flippase Atl1